MPICRLPSAHICRTTRRLFSVRRSTTRMPRMRTTRQEEAAFRIAWAAVKRIYEKIGDEWVEKG